MICPKCNSTINISTPEVLEFHNAMCAKWAAERAKMRTNEFRQYCTNCTASCEGYAIDDSWVNQECVFCGAEMEGFRLLPHNS